MRVVGRLTGLIAAALAVIMTLPATAGGHGHFGYGAHYRHYGHGDEAVALLAGLFIGGLAGYLISEDRHRQPTYYRPPSYYQPPPPTHTHSVVPVTPVTTRVPTEFRDCVMTREYTASVNIDGKQRDAYGTRCMRTDGSWELGRLKLAPVFD